jgi:hypothetical protein
MAIPSRQIGWGTEENLLWQISKQLEQLTNVTANACANNVSTYKVFTALLTQSGPSSPAQANYTNLEPLVIGQSYEITDNSSLEDDGTDFTNVGAANNNVGTFFIATGTTPIWGTGDGAVEYNEGAPVATVLENTIGNIVFQYVNVGNYIAYSPDNLFIAFKTTANSETFYDADLEQMISMYPSQIIPDAITIESRIITTGFNTDDVLNATLFEIKVYN